jgi:hypothetical protein
MKLFIAKEFPKGQKDPFNIKDMWLTVALLLLILWYVHVCMWLIENEEKKS